MDKNKIIIKAKDHSRKMDKEELQNYLKMKRQFNGKINTKKQYNRKQAKKEFV